MKFSSVPAHSFSHSPKTTTFKNDNPGPGEYTLFKTTLYNEPHWKIGTQKREVFKSKVESPGPGAYNVPLNISAGPKYSMLSKLNLIDDKKRNNFPGPGSYKPMLRTGSYFFSFGSKNKREYNKRDTTPGPGNYQLRKDKDMVMPSYLFGKEKKDNQIVRYKRDVPGPGAYNYSKEFILLRNPKYSFGSKLKLRNRQDLSPGPGAYNCHSVVGKEGTKITFGIKLNRSVDQDTPGPGAYKESKINFYKKSSPYTKLGKSKRLLKLFKTNNNPGPGQYNNLDGDKYIHFKSPSWKMGTSLRKSLSTTDISIPGVGKYSISGKPGANSPKFSFLKRILNKLKDDVPGPGRYESTNMSSIYNKSPTWKIGTSTRYDEIRKSIKEGLPGPGNYEHNTDQKNIIKYKHIFGVGKRFSVKRSNDIPGPGSYHIPCSFVDVSTYSRDKGNFDDKFKFI